MSSQQPTCPHCGGHELYAKLFEFREYGSAMGDYVQTKSFIQDAGDFFAFAKFHMVICGTCGRTEMFADEAMLPYVRQSPDWQRLAGS